MPPRRHAASRRFRCRYFRFSSISRRHAASRFFQAASFFDFITTRRSFRHISFRR